MRGFYGGQDVWAGVAFDVFGAGQAVSGVANAAASIAGATIQASAARDAAKMATDSANRSADLVQGRYDTTRSDLMPYQQEGQTATNYATDFIPAYRDDGSGYVAAMDAANPQANITDSNVVTPASHITSVVPGRMDQATLEATPGYQFALSQGLKATQNSAAARGLGVSGAAMKGAAAYATGLADNTYQQQFNQLQTQFTDQNAQDAQVFGQGQTQYSDQLAKLQAQFGQAQQGFTNQQAIGTFDQTGRTNSLNRLNAISTLGENAAAQTGTAGTQAATAAGNYLTSGASGAAAGTLASGNAIAGGLNGLANAYSQYNAQNQLLGSGGSYANTSGSTWDGAGTTTLSP